MVLLLGLKFHFLVSLRVVFFASSLKHMVDLLEFQIS